MSVIGNPLLLGGADAAFTTQRSVRLRSSASAYLTRTTATAGNRKTWTWSGWVKRGTLGGSPTLFANNFAGTGGLHYIQFNSDTLFMYVELSASIKTSWATTAVFRDPSAWYHIVVVFDTTQSVVANMGKIYVNGVLQTITTNNYAATYISQNADGWINASGYAHYLGSARAFYTNQDYDGYLTEINFVDGQALTPSSFGEYDSVRNTQWKPKAYSGSWGTNGFYLPFGNNASIEALGYDSANRQSELVTNGMFVANVTGWTIANGTTLSWQSGSLARVSNTASAACEAYIPISTIVGQTYYVQFNVAAVSLGAAGRNVGIYKADNTTMSSNIAFIGGTVAGTYRGTFTATATTTYIFLFGDTYGSGYADFSSVSVSLDSYKNSWKPFGISLTAGVTYDSMTDVPTLTSETASNFCVLNPVSTNVSGIVPQQGNLYLGSSATYNYSIVGTIGVSSGKWYWECRTDSGFSMVGITSLSSLPLQIAPHQSGSLAKIIYAAAAQKYDNGTSSAYGATWTSADLIGIALDMDAGTLTFYKNGTSLGVAFSGLTGIYYPIFGGPNSYNHGWINFGQRPFEQTVPTNFKRLNTYNLLDGAVTSSDDYHKVYTYTGNGGGQQVGEIQKPASLFNLDRSLRFRASASAYLNRTAGTATSTTTWTWSAWVKRGTIGTTQVLFSGGTSSSNNACIGFTSDSLDVYNFISSVIKARKITTQVFRDPLAWNHIVVAASGSSSLNVYVNGIQVTSFSTNTNPDGSAWLFQSGSIRIGADAYAASNLFDGYLADVYFIDGQALDPTSFGQYDGNYYWTPKAYSGTYGTNGWHLEFEDFSAATAAAIGKDTSGQGNNWTPSAGINLTTPANTNASWDSMVDVPTLTSADVANYCTLNPLRSFVSGSAATFTDGNLAVSIPAVLNPPRNVTSTYDVFSGKWYWEVIAGTVASNFVIGIASKAMDFNATIFTTGSYLYDATNGNKIIGGTTTSYGASYTTNDVIGIALDMDAGTLTFYKNGVSQGVAVTGLQGLTVTPVIAASGSSAITGTFNFGQRPFKYSNYGTDRPAATFKPINSFNIAEVTGDLESPDFVWIKSRSAGTNHALFNSVTGVGKYLSSNLTGTEVTDVNSLIQFNKNGFLLGNSAVLNTLSATYVASAWKIASTTVTNTAGSISSQVRANTTAGISVVTYTGNGTNGATVGHGLGVAPKVVLYKTRSNSNDGCAFHASLGGTQRLIFASTSSGNLLASTDSTFFNNTAPSSSVLTLGTRSHVNDASGTWTYVAYCFAEIAGFSKFTSYAANGSSTDGPFVACGFAPRWIMIKRATGASGTGGWIMYDTSRSTYNTMSEYLFAEGAAGGNTLAAIDVTANGFKIKTNNVHLNQTANDIYIVMAFAEHPFKYSLAR